MQQNSCLTTAQDLENPLLWPILEVLRKQPSGWKVHILASELIEHGLIPILDSKPEKDLFKRNFLIMNALYQLQETLYPEQFLQVEAMNIALLSSRGMQQGRSIEEHDPLREYYTDWANYEAEQGEIRRLLDEFWSRYRDYVGSHHTKFGNVSRDKALRVFDLHYDATDSEIRKRWRKLALKWHPDRQNGDSEQFRLVCEAWHVLRA
ncbi:molecular chaperone DnaJ [Vibrio ponticus]|uniref:Molecular chaperone DnaJ n=1 Tax=Vibrio ponticus TaxID=265668 RepID=A0ABX3F8K5_9VIBR|nr:DNA-J related domain-containing protein [Vibrio ponticus]OLQ87264.1 molecular chaperone DnaJ [Vibrio ponticus]